MNRTKLDPWDKRRHPDKYDPQTLRQMLVADIVAGRAPGGPMEKGAAFLIGACERIRKANGWATADDAFQSICAEAASISGHTNVALA